jgi:hypothetical protein
MSAGILQKGRLFHQAMFRLLSSFNKTPIISEKPISEEPP